MLTKTEISKARPREKKYTLSDIRGLHLDVMPTGRKFWRLRYTRGGKKSWFTIGEYPVVSIDEARERTLDLQERLRSGMPLTDEIPDEPDVLFSGIAAEWLAFNDGRTISTKSKKVTRFEMSAYVLPFLGASYIRKITPQDVLSVLRRISDASKPSIVVRAKTYISQLFRYAAARGLADHDPVAMLQGALAIAPHKHYRTISNSDDIGRLLRAINAYPVKRARLAAYFVMYSLCRPGEMRRAEWSEIDIERREWRVPAEKMKKRRPHIVPLSSQLLSIIEAMRYRESAGPLIFGSDRMRSGEQCALGVNVIPKMLKRIGFGEVVTAHGFRAMGSTILNEHGFNRDWIERQLAHAEYNESKAAYNYADYLDDRREMLAWYGDYLDGLRGELMDLSLGA